MDQYCPRISSRGNSQNPFTVWWQQPRSPVDVSLPSPVLPISPRSWTHSVLTGCCSFVPKFFEWPARPRRKTSCMTSIVFDTGGTGKSRSGSKRRMILEYWNISIYIYIYDGYDCLKFDFDGMGIWSSQTDHTWEQWTLIYFDTSGCLCGCARGPCLSEEQG